MTARTHRPIATDAPAAAEGYFTLLPGELRIDADATRAAAEFATTRAILCHGAVPPDLVARLDRICDAAEFRSDMVAALGHRRIETPALAGPALSVLLRRSALHRWLERVSGCALITDVEGRVVQTYARSGDALAWHDDVAPRRRLAVTIALTSPTFAGGAFELRDKRDGRVLLRYTHDRPGTALIFAVSPAHEHRVLRLRAGGPRRVFAGWFLGA